MALQIQALSFDSQQLSQAIRDQSNQAILSNTASTIALMTLFAAFFIAIYLLNFRRTLKSISDLKTGIAIIGSGNLEHEVQAGNKDEISDISKSVNQMSTNLKNVTASKIELETQIAERKKAEEAMEKQADLINLSPDAIIVRKLDGVITFWSKGAEKLYGFTKDEAIGQNINDLLKTELPQSLETIQNTLKTEGKWSGEVIHICKDGSKLVVQSYWLSKFDSNGKIFEMLESNVDITQRMQMQVKLEESAIRLEEYANQMEELANQRAAQLKDAERLATIGATAGMVGHDIRNPLQAITGDVFLAKTELTEFPESEEKENLLESLNEIEKNTDYINKIVQDLQDFARPLNPIPQETNLKVVIDELLEKNGVPKNVKVTVKVDNAVDKIVADSTFINRIMYNLVNNAFQAMPKGGKLTINAYKKVNNVVITVSDTGVGISENVKSKLFTPLFTTKSKGQGFGLAVIKRMTEALGGTVSFESEEGKGTTFTLNLPQPKS
jgi:PAS domain S-box-containing protein